MSDTFSKWPEVHERMLQQGKLSRPREVHSAPMEFQKVGHR